MDSSPSSPKETSTLEALRDLIHKRISTFAYLQRVHNGGAHYFNTILLSEEDLSRFYNNKRLRKRSQKIFILGTSLGPILEITTTPDYVKALHQIIHEYEHFVSDGSKTKKRNFFRKSKFTGEQVFFNTNFQETGEYIHLDVRTTPFEPDYLQILHTFCDIMVVVYTKLMEGIPEFYRSPLAEVVSKIDTKFKKILAVINRDLDLVVHTLICRELEKMDPLPSPKNGTNAAEDWEAMNALHI
ncbi:hypothetical protein K493DRAFT_314495 [Basidiobolus meristosporus CBS 931.73]|uniref:Uncharacterized protein n=1 Tax=Basidiobolus meristosporus CBS 931.73 TaxID=1314790 RepID=A0A1Y1YEU8_9FUNG|nr:hypothetical protein K493DRAFT_314495 [Basidiobolus meristosporus CBS 931.73]|eukprot:ORX96485.1 hypothetical protein K493DRAFT_314495 [Basidiobolus meristosporus CBS 931.73]